MRTIILLIAILFLFPTFALAADVEFDSNMILYDEQMFGYKTWSKTDIQDFLDSKNSYLATYQAEDIDGNMKLVSQIIYNAGFLNDVNPKFLVAMLQKEQGLITKKNPTQRNLDFALGYGVCDNCNFNDPNMLLFQGFGKQVHNCAGLMQWYVQNADEAWLKKMNQTYTIDGHEVTPVNQATTNLYNYTPHIQGNYLLWQIWQGWFEDEDAVNAILEPIEEKEELGHPDGSLLKTADSPVVWLLRDNELRPFDNWAAFISRFEPGMIITVDNSVVAKYKKGASIKFAQYSLLQLPSGGIYMVDDDYIRPIASQEVFKFLGFNPEEVVPIKQTELSGYKLGSKITLEDAYPTGALLQDNTTGGVYFAKNGVKQPIHGKEVIDLNYPNYQITPVSPDELAVYETGKPAQPKDGLLIKWDGDPGVFVIAKSYRHRITSEDAFLKLGYSWDNIITISKNVMYKIPLGADLSV